MSEHKLLEVPFTDKFGEPRVIHKTRHGLKLKRRRSTVCNVLSKVVGQIVGEKIKAKRKRQGLTLEQLCDAAGIVSSTPKNRMWEIEGGSRGLGIRLGTLFAIAHALQVSPSKLLPTVEEAMDKAGVSLKSTPPSLQVEE